MLVSVLGENIVLLWSRSIINYSHFKLDQHQKDLIY